MTQTVLATILLRVSLDDLVTNIWIAIVVTLLTFSLISERIIYFIKLHSPLLRNRSLDSGIENRRQKNIFYVEILIGLVVTLLASVLLSFMLNGKDSIIDVYKKEPLYILLGLFILGLPISFMAKFWQSMLEMLSHFSNLKMYQSLELQIQSQKHSENTKDKLAKIAKTLSPRLQSLPGYTKYEIAEYGNGKSIIQFFFSPEENELPASIKELRERISGLINEYEVLLLSK